MLGVPYADLSSKTARALLRRGLLRKHGNTVAITDAGQALLAHDGDRAFQEIISWLKSREATEFLEQ